MCPTRRKIHFEWESPVNGIIISPIMLSPPKKHSTFFITNTAIQMCEWNSSPPFFRCGGGDDDDKGKKLWHLRGEIHRCKIYMPSTHKTRDGCCCWLFFHPTKWWKSLGNVKLWLWCRSQRSKQQQQHKSDPGGEITKCRFGAASQYNKSQANPLMKDTIPLSLFPLCRSMSGLIIV